MTTYAGSLKEKESFFSFVVDGVIAGCPRPSICSSTCDDVLMFKRMGIGGVVTLTEMGLKGNSLNKAGIDYLHLPVRDYTAPSIQQIRDFCDFIDFMRSCRKAVVVHCLAGRGRTGTFLACWLVTQGRSVDEAIAEVRRQRPGSIEASVQEDLIAEWWERCMVE